MGQFVNYKKRSFTLPPGCKNLIDVLERSRRSTRGHVGSGGFQPFELREERIPTAGLAQIGRYVAMLLQSRAELFILSVTAQDFQLPVTLYRSRSEKAVAIVLVTKEVNREDAIRAFFEQQGLKAFLAEQDVGDARSLAYPLPLDVAHATSLTAELLRSVYGVSNEAGLDFRYYEMQTAA